MAHIVKLLEKKEIAEGTMSFTFEKPQGYTFQPGQATDWTLIEPRETDDEGNGRSFSLACAPEDEFVRLATRMRDTAFKRTLRNMNAGDTISMDDPWGDFTLDGTNDPVVFLAGGIGITPFISMLRHAAETGSMKPITIFFSNRRPEDAPFLDEIERAASENKAITLVATMAEMEKSKKPWSGETGFIDAAMLNRHLKDLSAPTYYIAGPPAMVAAMNGMLKAVGVDSTHIRLDEFLGY